MPAWADRQEDSFRDRRLLGQPNPRLEDLGRLFIQKVRSSKIVSKAGHGVFATATDEEGYECPCDERHRWPPSRCDVVQFALFGKASRSGARTPRKKIIDKCKERLKGKQWKKVVKELKSSSSSSPSGNWPPDMVHMTLTPCTEDNKPTSPSIFSLTSPHPLRDSTIYDHCAAIHVVNNKTLLKEYQPAEDDDYVLVGDTSLKVIGRGKRVIEKVFHGPNGRHTRDLVLKDVAFVPNFHTNIISADLLFEQGYWFHGEELTLRWGKSPNSVVVMNLERKYRLLVAQYKPVDRSYFYLPRSNAGVFVFRATRTAQNQPRLGRRRSTQLQPDRSDATELWHCQAGHLGPEVLKKLVLAARGVHIRGIPGQHCEVQPSQGSSGHFAPSYRG